MYHLLSDVFAGTSEIHRVDAPSGGSLEILHGIRQLSNFNYCLLG